MRKIIRNAGPLRRNMTDAEQRMWHHLRGRRLGGFKFKRQWSLGPYVVDFCCIERMLVVEIDGGQHSTEKDAYRTAHLNALGYRVLRFWNNDVLENTDGVLTSLLSELDLHPHPNPLPQAGEGVHRAPPDAGIRGRASCRFKDSQMENRSATNSDANACRFSRATR